MKWDTLRKKLYLIISVAESDPSNDSDPGDDLKTEGSQIRCVYTNLSLSGTELVRLNKVSRIYDIVMMITIILSLIPLAFKGTNALFQLIDYATVAIFIADYILRLITADIGLDHVSTDPLDRKSGWLGTVKPFLRYPFTPMAIIDLLSILPSLTPLGMEFKLLKLFRLFRAMRVLRIVKFVRYSESIDIIIRVIRNQKMPLLAVCSLAGGYVLIAALVIFNVEPDTFDTFFEAVYWAMVSLTTVGYGDIYPVTTVGRIVTMLSSFLGIAIVALPAGIITAGYMDVINDRKRNK